MAPSFLRPTANCVGKGEELLSLIMPLIHAHYDTDPFDHPMMSRGVRGTNDFFGTWRRVEEITSNNWYTTADDIASWWLIGRDFGSPLHPNPTAEVEDRVRCSAFVAGQFRRKPMDQWDDIYRDIFSLIVPGGWIEHQEFLFYDGFLSSNEYLQGLPAHLAEFPHNINPGREIAVPGVSTKDWGKLGVKLRDAGFGSLHTVTHTLPIGAWTRSTSRNSIGLAMKAAIEDMIVELESWAESSVTEAENAGFGPLGQEHHYLTLAREFRSQLEDDYWRLHVKVVSMWAQKPHAQVV